MKIKLTSGLMVDGKAVKSGKVIEASDATARYLIGSGQAEEVKAEAKPEKTTKKVKKDAE